MSEQMVSPEPGRLPHRWAILTALVTLPLMLMGAEVTSKGVGMVDPQGFREPWHMLKVPLQELGLGFVIEHSHRLLGFLVGTCTIILAILLYRKEDRKWVKTLGLLALVGICLQGALGGFRVQLNQWMGEPLKLIHGLFAQVVFSLLVTIALVTSPRWRRGFWSEANRPGAPAIRRWSILVVCAVFAQIILGGLTRHYSFGWGPRLHVLGASMVVAALCWMAHLLLASGAFQKPLSSGVKILGVLLVVQILLGLEAWLTKFQSITAAGVTLKPSITPGPISSEVTFQNLLLALTTHPDLFRSLHFITGSLILATTVSMALVLHQRVIVSSERAPTVRGMEGAA